MTVTRRVEVVYDAPDERAAIRFAEVLREVAMGGEWPFGKGYNAARHFGVTGQSFTAEPVIPSPEPLVESP